MAVGPLEARFNGSLAFTEQDPPNSCVMRFKGQGGAVGFAQGSARVTLEEAAGQTAVRYTAEANIGGRLAQLGSRMIESVARRSSDQFFSAFQQAVGGPRDGTGERSAGVAEAALTRAVADVAAPGARRGAGVAYLVPAWWLFVATAVGAGLAMAAFVVAR
ncbi:MAG TPA: SRPBCC domain-containing protein [Burkholderiaceae bacterium]|jgi:hypothetical protein